MFICNNCLDYLGKGFRFPDFNVLTLLKVKNPFCILVFLTGEMFLDFDWFRKNNTKHEIARCYEVYF